MSKEPKRQKPRHFQLIADEVFLDDLDSLRRLEPDIPTRSEMVRRAIARERERQKGRKVLTGRP